MAQPRDSSQVTPINNPPQAPQGQPGFGNPRRDFGTALTGIGTNLMAAGAAEYFDSPAIGEAIQGLTEATTSMMHQRFWKSEFENFQQTYGKQYETQAQQTLNNYLETDNSFGNKYDPETMQARTQAMQGLMSQIQQLDIEFMQNAAKFGHNPMINEVANGLMQQRAQWMQGMLGASGEVANDANAQALLQKAQFEVSPEMQDLKKQEARAGIAAKQAQAGESRARAGLLGAQARSIGEEPGDDLGKIPAGKLKTWLVTDPKGRKYLEPYAQSKDAKLRAKLIEKNPRLKFEVDELDRRVRAAAPQIRKEAVLDAMEDILPGDVLSSVLSKSPLIEEGGGAATDSPTIVAPLQPKEIKSIVEGDENTSGMGEALVLPAVRYLAMQSNIKSFRDLQQQLQAAVEEEVRTMVGDFEGSKDVRRKLENELMSYYKKNWKKIPELSEKQNPKLHGLLAPNK